MIENLDEIKSRLDSEQVLRLIGYHKSNPISAGNELRDFCPIHAGDNQRSLSINTATKLVHCHSCDFKGDLIRLYSTAKNMEFKDGIKDLAAQFGVEIKFKGATKITAYKRTPQQVLKESSLQGNHPYLKEKRIEACLGLYFGKDEKGNDSIVVPLYDIDGHLQSIQFINHGGKFFLRGTPAKGAFFAIGSLKEVQHVYLAEGLATALTIYMALDKKDAVISFGSAGNLATTVDAIKAKYPTIKIIICLDNNDAAFEQAKKINPAHRCSYRVPSFEGLVNSNMNDKPLADFNDIVSKCNQPISAVKEQLSKELSVAELPFKQRNNLEVREAASPSSLNEECQEELLSYLFHQSFNTIMSNGFSAESFEPDVFTDCYRDIMVGMIKTWEQGLPLSVVQIALNSSDTSSKIYALLKRIENRSSITAKQATERLARIKNDYVQSQFNGTLATIQSNDKPIHDKIEHLRNSLDRIQAITETVLSQSCYISKIIDEIHRPTRKILATGIVSLDRLIGGGFIKAELGMLAGGAGAGKTAFALQIADSVAQKGGIVIYVSVEIGRDKLTERSLKRLSYRSDKESKKLAEVVNDYEKFASNIYLVKGRHGMQVSEIRAMVLSVSKQRHGGDILLIIDPFQRLGTGNEKIDCSNEALKIGTLCSQIKEMAGSLDIPILALSDTVKDHKNNKSGEGAIRGTYMGDHTADYVMMLRAARSPLEAIYGESDPKPTEHLFVTKIKEKVDTPAFKEGLYALKNDWDKYASLVTSKVRDSGIFSPLFVYRPAYHYFQDTEIWKDILSKGAPEWQ